MAQLSGQKKYARSNLPIECPKDKRTRENQMTTTVQNKKNKTMKPIKRKKNNTKKRSKFEKNFWLALPVTLDLDQRQIHRTVTWVIDSEYPAGFLIHLDHYRYTDIRCFWVVTCGQNCVRASWVCMGETGREQASTRVGGFAFETLKTIWDYRTGVEFGQRSQDTSKSTWIQLIMIISDQFLHD